jgi:hypothetical protein
LREFDKGAFVTPLLSIEVYGLPFYSDKGRCEHHCCHQPEFTEKIGQGKLRQDQYDRLHFSVQISAGAGTPIYAKQFPCPPPIDNLTIDEALVMTDPERLLRH